MTSRHGVPLRCLVCGETWIGPPSMIGKSCALSPVGSPDVVQCEPEELSGSVNWNVEAF